MVTLFRKKSREVLKEQLDEGAVFLKHVEIRKKTLQQWFSRVGLRCSAFRALSSPLPELFVEMPDFIQDMIDLILSNEKHLFIRGDLGVGKTTHMLLFNRELAGFEDNLGHSFKSGFIPKTGLHRRQIMQEIAGSLGVKYYTSWNSNRIVDVVEKFIRENYPSHRTLLFLEDVADNTPEALQKIKYLGDLEEDERICTLVMSGTQEYWDALQSIIPLLTSRCELIDAPFFGLKQSREFIRKRLAYFSSNPEGHDKGIRPFTEGAVRILYKASEGNPRRLRGYCRRCESVAAERYRLEKNEVVDEDIVEVVTSA